MINVQTFYSGQEVCVSIPDGLSLWSSDSSGELKSYIASKVFTGIFSLKGLNLGVKYHYVNYENSYLFDKKVVDGFLANNSFVVIDNMEIIVRVNPDLVRYLSSKCPTVLIGRHVGLAGLKSKDITTYVNHKIEENKIWVGALK